MPIAAWIGPSPFRRPTPRDHPVQTDTIQENIARRLSVSIPQVPRPPLCIVELDAEANPTEGTISCLIRHGLYIKKSTIQKPPGGPPGPTPGPGPSRTPQPKGVLPLVFSMQNTPLANTLIGSLAIPYPATVVEIAASAGDSGSSAAGTPACEFVLTASTSPPVDVAEALLGEVVIPLAAGGGAISSQGIHVPFGTDIEMFVRYPLPLYPGFLNLIGRTCVIAGAPAALHVTIMLEDTGRADLALQFTPSPTEYDYYSRYFGAPRPPRTTAVRTAANQPANQNSNMLLFEQIAQELRGSPFGRPGGFVRSRLANAGITNLDAAEQIVLQLSVRPPNLSLLASSLK